MNWLLLLFNFWVIATALASFAALLPAFYCFDVGLSVKPRDGSSQAFAQARRDRWMMFAFGFFCLSVAIEAGNTALTMGALPTPRSPSPWIIGLRMAGRLFETCAAVWLALRLSGLIGRRRRRR